MIICGGKWGRQERHEAEDKLHITGIHECSSSLKKNTVEETDSAFKIMLTFKKRVYSRVRVAINFSPKPVWFPIHTVTLERKPTISLVLKHEAKRPREHLFLSLSTKLSKNSEKKHHLIKP